jgi:hypothetical protein
MTRPTPADVAAIGDAAADAAARAARLAAAQGAGDAAAAAAMESGTTAWRLRGGIGEMPRSERVKLEMRAERRRADAVADVLNPKGNTK